MGRKQTDETKLKISQALKGRKRTSGANYFNGNPHKRYVITSEKSKEILALKMKRMSQLPWNETSLAEKRRRVFAEQSGLCNKCQLKNWLDMPITLELEHIDGNHYNNERYNLEILCPNCHSQTPTFRNRKRPMVK